MPPPHGWCYVSYPMRLPLPACLIVLLTGIRLLAAPWTPPVTTRNFNVIEVLGVPGTRATTFFTAPADGSTLWLQVNGLSYQNKMSIQVNGGAWISLNNTNCVFDYPANLFRGMGGPLDTLSFRVPSVSLVPGRANMISFRFNYSDGVSIGFRVLAINVLDTAGQPLLGPSKPVTARLTSTSTRIAFSGVHAANPGSSPAALAGSNLWYNGSLRENWNGRVLQARCTDCHADDGSDLQYYGYSDRSIIERSRFHGLTVSQGQQIAAYIRALPTRTLGTPWNPPYQPGPGLDSRPIEEWAAGAGLQWVLPDDSFSWDYIYPNRNVVVYWEDKLNTRQIPIALQMPDWKSWLPRVHPKDSIGSSFNPVYAAELRCRNAVAAGDLRVRFGEIDAATSDWLNSPTGDAFRAANPGNLFREAWTGVARWRTVKAWHVIRSKGWEDDGKSGWGPTADDRFWPTHSVFMSSPHFTLAESGHSLGDGSPLTWGVRSEQWYWLQLVLSGSLRTRNGAFPFDWAYMNAFTMGLNTQHRFQNAGMMMVALIKAGEATSGNPGHGNDGFNAFGSLRTEYLWNREGSLSMWQGYDPALRDAVIRGWLAEYEYFITYLGRNHFINVTGEVREGEYNNNPSSPHTQPWIRSHGGMLVHFKNNGAAPDIVETMRRIGRFLWPDANWERL
jgi:hypothetical protein